MSWIHIIIAVVGAVAGAVLALYLYIQKLRKTNLTANSILASARKEAENIKR